MKFFLNRYFPWLTKRFSFFLRGERTFGDIDRKEINATQLQEICAFIDPSLRKRNLEVASNYLLPHNKNASPRPQRSEFPRMYPGRLDTACAYIKESGFAGHIILKTTSDSPSDELKIDCVIFKNLKIKGAIEINISTLKEIEFTNNESSDNVKIQVDNGTFTATIENNFLKNFALLFNDAHIIFISNNDISHQMDMSFSFSPVLDGTDFPEVKQTYLSTLFSELFMRFSKNKINYLNINDVSDKSDQHNLENIGFAGSNHIKTLAISTKHTTLTSYEQVKADINRIFFNASDKIGLSIPGANSTDDDVAPSACIENSHQLAYGRLFSLLEIQVSERHDRVNEEMYMRKVRHFYRKFSPRWEDRFSLTLTNWLSKDGISWFRPLCLLVITQTSLAAIAYCLFAGYDLQTGKECVMHWDMQCKPYIEEGWGPFGALVAWFMNPASLLPPIPITMASWPIYLLFLCHKTFAVIFYYFIIKALRRFFRRSK